MSNSILILAIPSAGFGEILIDFELFTLFVLVITPRGLG
ncbi:MAG: hypothetical protein ACJATI_003889 [Halioglobus sp.]|jgi:hypothetical protein